MQLTKSVYVETKRIGANVGYVVTEDGVVMIDSPQVPSDAVTWKREIESRGTIRYLIKPSRTQTISRVISFSRFLS